MNKPINGVVASISPNKRPILRAKLKRGRLILTPLPIAAANASVDIAKASKIRAKILIVLELRSG